MKRAGRLWPQVIDRENLRLAFHKALRSKRGRSDARRFAENLEANLAEMSRGMTDGTYPVGRFHQFVIHDPKERIITAPCFAERVLHHAMTNVTEPVFERWLIDDTFACRKFRGRIAAITRAREFARRFPYFLKIDVHKYFDSIVHDRLLAGVQRLFKDRQVLLLYDRVVRSFRGPLGRGLPIGSLTSQHLANFFLGALDRFAKETLRVDGYVRYMDDVALWGDSSRKLSEIRSACSEFLRERLHLSLKPEEIINRTAGGMTFLGCRVFPRHTILSARSRRRLWRRLRKLETLWLNDQIDEAELQRRATATVAFTQTASVKSWRFRRTVVQRLSVGGQQARTA